MSARVVAVVNMKGGVGKSTVVVALSEFLASEHKRKVLVIDLDPQANSSMVLAGPDRWADLRRADKTIDAFFEPHLYNTALKPLSDFIGPKVSDIAGGPPIDVVISTPEFRYTEREAIERFVAQGFAASQVRAKLANVMRDAVRKAGDRYDMVIFDCPPGISYFAEAAILMADVIVMPTIPDYMSRMGLEAFTRRTLKPLTNRRARDEAIRVLISKYDEGMQLHRAEMASIREDYRAFEAVIPQDQQIARAAEWSDDPRTLEVKYGARTRELRAFAQEVVDLCDASPAALQGA